MKDEAPGDVAGDAMPRLPTAAGGAVMCAVLGRRRLGMMTLALMGTMAGGRAAPARAVPPEAAIAGIEDRHGGRLGVFARDTGTGRIVAHRADERFLLMSTFKGPLAAMVLARVDAGADALDRPVPYGSRDLVVASPVTAAHAAAGALTIAQLVAAILERSDNTAANLLLRRVGGPGALTAWLRSAGDRVTTVARYEATPGQSGPENTTTPRAIAATAARISLGDLLRPSSRALNDRWMMGNALGSQRLRGGFPPTWPAIDRTGTGDDIRNDYAVVWPPGRAPLVIAAYYEGHALVEGVGEAVLRAVGAAIAISMA